MTEHQTFDVLVPRRSDGGWRDELWEYVRRWWESAGVKPIVTFHEDGPFNKCAAINAAARLATSEFVVIADADALPSAFEQVENAVALAAETGGLVLAFDEYFALTRAATREIIAGETITWADNVRWTNPKHVASCVVVPRALFDLAGGFDERFVGWGFEDRAFFEACKRLAGVDRVSGRVYHLWHPRSPEKNPESLQYQSNADLAQRYRSATTREAMLDLVGEART